MTIAVSRAAPGNLAEGAESKLRRADAVDAVESLDIRGLQPGLNDLTVEADATVALAGDAGEDREAVADALAEQFGVTDVSVTAVRSVPPDVRESRGDSRAGRNAERAGNGTDGAAVAGE
ncbi:hypothetical protein [Halobaculum gomorrense]|uniref:Uncharacterized protein n=1 Tax=Halobaculum gomorrense TaxID=43928 RepID=A0A1M5M3V5_9EURY|nr:hypothetical protein [Halobaculum gomorrense]SHG71955.1 hypothetical protein SAMN05443636_0875 [Halobaculum gomorrense]